MKTIFYKLLSVTLFLFLCVTNVRAYDFEADGIYYNIIDTEKVEVTKGGYSGDIVIPSTVDFDGKTYSVTSIGDNAFAYCYGLTSIEIPNSVSSIGYCAFGSCTGLTSIEIPNSVTNFGVEVFFDCDGLTRIVVEEGNTKYDSRDNCNAIIETATNTLISGCKNTTIPNSVTSIGYYAFDGCSGLASITIPSSVTSIGDGAFAGCDGLTSIVVEEGNTKYDSRDNCNALIETATNTLIFGCKSTTIPNSVTSIGDGAFYDCTRLTSIEIPNSVTSIDVGAFRNCSGLTSIVVEEGNTKYDSRDNCNAIIETETNTLIAGFENTIIPNSVTTIGDKAFAQCTSLTSITIPNSVTTIGDMAFYFCTGLTSVTIPNSVTSIGNWAFNGCSGLTSITIPNSVTNIESGAFWGCSGLTSITIPNSVTNIGWNAFTYCTGLTSITIPNSVTSIGWYAFSDCSGLTSITIPNSVTSIGMSTFSDCSGLTSITIPNSVTNIEDYAFSGCTGLTSIYCMGKVPAYINSYSFPDEQYETITLYVPTGSLEKYKTADIWMNFKNIVEFDATNIDDIVEGSLNGGENVYYDLNGRKVENPTHGIYIVNGKKVFVK